MWNTLGIKSNKTHQFCHIKNNKPTLKSPLGDLGAKSKKNGKIHYFISENSYQRRRLHL